MDIKIKQQGFSLIELMVSIVAGLIVVGGVMSVYLSTIKSSSATLQQSKLNQELTTAMNIMTNDIRRAGVWRGMTVDSYNNPDLNPFSDGDGKNTALRVINDVTNNNVIAVEDMVGGTSNGGECVVYAYDAVNPAGVVDDQDVVGFRRVEDADGIGSIEMRISSSDALNYADCSDTNNTWEAITDNRVIDITSLNFTLANSACINASEFDGEDDPGDADTNIDNIEEIDCYIVPVNTDEVKVETREVTVSIEGTLRNNSDSSLKIEQSVRVRNELVTKG